MGFLMTSMAFGGTGGGLMVIHLTSLGIAYCINMKRKEAELSLACFVIYHSNAFQLD